MSYEVVEDVRPLLPARELYRVKAAPGEITVFAVDALTGARVPFIRVVGAEDASAELGVELVQDGEYKTTIFQNMNFGVVALEAVAGSFLVITYSKLRRE